MLYVCVAVVVVVGLVMVFGVFEVSFLVCVVLCVVLLGVCSLRVCMF
jgi:hypothetical protein